MNKKILNQVPFNYYDSGVSSNLFQFIWHSWKWYSLKPVIKNFKGKVLDVGCADGTLTAKIADYLPNSKVTGLDLYEKSIDYAAQKYPNVDFIRADARKIPFKNNYFDYVLCVETLEHVRSSTKVVREINRVLRKGGTFVVVQDSDSRVFNLIWSIWIKWKGRVWLGAHVNCMKPNEIKNLLKEAKFKIIETRHSHFGLEVIFRARK